MMPPLTSQARRSLAVGFAAAVLAAAVHAQATPKSAVPSAPASPTPGLTIDSQTTDTQPTSTIKVQVRRVVVDVTVTDAKGKPVQGLTEQDFHVFEDGAPQTVRSFEIHTAEPQAPLKLPKLPLNTFANLSTAPTGGPTTVILYDLLNTPLDAQPFAHAQLLDFLKQRKASGQVAIFVLSDKLHMLQGFTDDDNKLIAALNLQKDHYRSGLLQTQAETTQGSDQLARTDGNQNGADARQDESFQDVSAMLKHMETLESSYMLDRRVDYTAQALEEIARFLIGLPGRKNLLWLSGSFPDGIIPNSGADGRDPIAGQDEFDVTRNYSSEIQMATNELNLSHVAVYPVDVRGLQVNGMFSAASSQTFEPGQGKDSAAVQNFSQTLTSEHATMDVIGNETGGRAFYNTNGLKDAAAEALQEGSLYYTLSYTPTNRSYDGKLRRVRVQLKQQGYHLAYRRSYFGNGLDEAARDQQDAPSDALAVTLEHGAPVAHELFFEAHVVSEGAPVPATPEQMDELIRYEAMATKSKRKAGQELKTPVLLQRYVVQYVLIPRQLDLRLGPDQARRDNLEFAAVSYNEDGLTLNGTRTQIQDVIRPDRWSMMQESGYHVPMAILVPVQARSLRLAVRDASNGHMGSLELSLPLPPEPAAIAPPEAPQPAPASVPPAS